MLVVCAAELKAAPANDDCSGAIALTAGVPYDGTTVGATGSSWSTCGFLDTIDVWHRFTPATTGAILVSLCGSSFDTTLAIFDGCLGAELACNDDSCGLQSELTVTMTGGQEYYIRVAGYDSDAGNYSLFVTEASATPPHDECANAVEVFEEMPHADVTTGATGVSWSSCADGGDTLDVWHKFIPDANSYYSISLCGSGFDTTLSLFDLCGGSEIACNDDFCDLQSQVSASLTQANTYYIRVAGYNGATGSYTLTVTEEVCERQDEPNNLNPPHLAVDVETNTTLSWNDGIESLNYSSSYVTPKVIYGDDDRMEEYEVSDPLLLAAGDSTAAVVSISDLYDNNDGTYSLPTTSFAEWYEAGSGRPLCSDEPYRDQPSPVWCSAFLVAPDIMATAGHCVSDSGECADVAFVFGFVMVDANTAVVTFDASQVYFCSEIIARQETSVEDWGLIRLDREVTDHAALSVRRTGKIDDGSDVTVIGHPAGLPRKYASGATVRDNSAEDYFGANVDTYGGNSGSAVFDTFTMEVEGILVRGNTDFVQDGSCDRSNVCPDSGCPGWEDVTRSTEFSDLIPSFDVYLGTDPCEMAIVCADVLVEGCNPGPLQCGTRYYWQVVAKNHCGSTEGPVWQFTTLPLGDLEHDCDVDFEDYSAWAACWKDNDCDISNNWCDGADFNSDNVVDFKDLRYVALNWLISE